MPSQTDIIKVERVVVEPMKANSIPGRNIDPVSIMALYYEDLAEFDEDILAEAYLTVRREKASAFWPRPEEIRKEAQRLCRPTGGVVSSVTPMKPDHWPAADGALGSELGQTALREGWGRDLQEFVRRSGKAPNEYEIDMIKRGLRDARLTVQALVANPESHFASKQMLGLWEAMEAREQYLKKRFLK